MKKVTRILGLVALVALVATSCKKNDEKTTMTFKATINQPTEVGSRTHIGAGNWLEWNANDAIKVFAEDGTSSVFTTTDADVVTANFAGSINPSSRYVAFYPAANISDMDGDGKVTMVSPATQQYFANGFANGAYPMAAINNGTEFKFHSPCGVFVLQFTGSVTVGSIVLTDGDGDPVAGELLVDVASFSPLAPSYTLGTTQTSVTLDCGTGVALDPATPTAFSFVLPGGIFDNGFTAVVKDLAGNTVKTLSTTHDNSITPEVILTMPSAEVEYSAPTVVTNAATDITHVVATINGSATAAAGTTITEVGFYWGTTNSLAEMTKVTATTAEPFAYDLTGLTASTTYYFAAYAIDNNGNEGQGSVLSFTTNDNPAVAPTVVTNAASNILANSAQLNGEVTSDGGSTIIARGFFWGLGSNPSTPVTVTGTTGAMNSFITSLLPNTTYYFKAFASNDKGTGFGEVMSFTTSEFVSGNYTAGADGHLITFAPGNLWYDGANWHMEDEQYMYHTVDGSVLGLFSWSSAISNYGLISIADNNEFVEWGGLTITKPHSTETYAPNTWRTPTSEEQAWVIYDRAHASNLRCVKYLEGVNCLVLMPDNYNYSVKPVSELSWTEIKTYGGFVMPMAGGYVDDPGVPYAQGDQFCWWSATPTTNLGQSHHVYYHKDGTSEEDGCRLWASQYHRMSVRLVVTVE